jgi:hypothetical protein
MRQHEGGQRVSAGPKHSWLRKNGEPLSRRLRRKSLRDFWCFQHLSAIINFLRPVNLAAVFWVIGWLVTDISVCVQLPDTFVISRYGSNFTQLHQFATVHRERALKIASLPADKQGSKQADVCGQHPAVGCHPPDPFTKGRSFLSMRYGYHLWPPSSTLCMSSNL